MSQWIAPAARWGALVLVLLAAAAIPDTGLMVSGPAGSPAWAADVLPDPADELPGLVAEQRFAGPAQVGDTGHPEIGELTTGVAPSPSGPTTYVPIFLYHYIRIISLHQAAVAIRNAQQYQDFRFNQDFTSHR